MALEVGTNVIAFLVIGSILWLGFLSGAADIHCNQQHTGEQSSFN